MGSIDTAGLGESRNAMALAGAIEAEVEPRTRDDARITAIVREHHAFVWRLLLRLGVPSRSAEDATQQVFLVATRRVSQIAEGSEKSFLFGTALRVASDERRSAKNRELSGELPEGADLAPSPEENAEAGRRRNILQEALLTMPVELRTVFVLFELEQMTKSEVSALVGVPVGTAVSRLRRAREMFREALRKRGLAEGQS
ncbi:MAG TPA: sigma-70 family RNA polymerase sigma factor [Polyangiaceae bacterium]|jgi:RNA polymerase sigma-70 factor (ECF subfamily)